MTLLIMSFSLVVSFYGTVFLLLMPGAFFVSGKRLKKTPEKKTGNKGKSPDIHLGI